MSGITRTIFDWTTGEPLSRDEYGFLISPYGVLLIEDVIRFEYPDIDPEIESVIRLTRITLLGFINALFCSYESPCRLPHPRAVFLVLLDHSMQGLTPADLMRVALLAKEHGPFKRSFRGGNASGRKERESTQPFPTTGGTKRVFVDQFTPTLPAAPVED